MKMCLKETPRIVAALLPAEGNPKHAGRVIWINGHEQWKYLTRVSIVFSG
eukprot:XP_001710072.1 Hypothetical protein GL50803_9978 [Giardia lamblia ATCC 50803]